MYLCSVHNLETIVALSTPTGAGAIAVIRLSGGNAIVITNRIFSKDISHAASHTLHFGRIMDKDAVLDEVVVGIFRAPKSYTREDVVEISCHGSGYIIQRIIQLCCAEGAILAKPGEFTMRAFLNGQMDLSQAEAVSDLIASGSEAAHKIAMQQMRGGFSNELKKLREELIHFASLVELELDFSEEDVEFANRGQMEMLVRKINSVIKQLIQSFELGNVIKTGVPVVIAGKPNVGKSTLLNALLNEERAIVSDIAGTTRDTIEEVISLQGIQFRFIDTAGIRETEDSIEAKGVAKTFEKIKQSAIILYLYDSVETSGLELEQILADLQVIADSTGSKLIAVANKSDKNTANNSNAGFSPIAISALTGAGINELQKALLDTINYHALQEGDVIVSNLRHVNSLQAAHEALQRVLNGIHNPITSDFLALDIKQALHHLGEITGSISTDDLLDNIFSKFCIGK